MIIFQLWTLCMIVKSLKFHATALTEGNVGGSARNYMPNSNAWSNIYSAFRIHMSTYIINHPTGNRYIHPTHNWYNQQRKQVWRKTQKKYHQSLCGSIKPSSKEGHKKVKSKLIKSTKLKEILNSSP